jgi:hypothetical protein
VDICTIGCSPDNRKQNNCAFTGTRAGLCRGDSQDLRKLQPISRLALNGCRTSVWTRAGCFLCSPIPWIDSGHPESDKRRSIAGRNREAMHASNSANLSVGDRYSPTCSPSGCHQRNIGESRFPVKWQYPRGKKVCYTGTAINVSSRQQDLTQMEGPGRNSPAIRGSNQTPPAAIDLAALARSACETSLRQ